MLCYKINGIFKSRRRLAAGAVLLGAVLAFGLHAGFHDGAWQTGADDLSHNPDHSGTGHAWVDMAGATTEFTLLPHAYAQTPDADAFVTTWNITGLPITTSFNAATVRFSIDVESGGEVHVGWGDGHTNTYDATGEPS